MSRKTKTVDKRWQTGNWRLLDEKNPLFPYLTKF